MEGGYVLINLADIKLFERLLITLDLGKPILLRDGKQNYFIDKITGGNVTAYEDDGITPSTYADIVLTTGINEITIKQNGTIIKTNIIDVDGINEVLDINQENGRVSLSAPNENLAPYISLSGNGIKFIDENGEDVGYIDSEGLHINSIEFSDESEMTTAPKLENIKDEDGNLRFVEGNVNYNTIEGVTSLYGKWSLSGTHLMVAYSLKVNDTAELLINTKLCDMTLPNYIYNKIIPLWGQSIERKNLLLYSSSGASQPIAVRLQKDTSNTIGIYLDGTLTLSAERNGRIQFDLLIDNE